MGGKCFGIKDAIDISPQYPKFTYLSTEAAMKIKFFGPNKLKSAKIPQQPDKRLPANAMTCKVSKNVFFIVGGINLYRWNYCANVFELDFENLKITNKADCPFVPIGGNLVLHNKQVYLLGSSVDTALPIDNIDSEELPYPFKKKETRSLHLERKLLKPSSFYRYSTVRDRWKEIPLKDELWEQDTPDEDKILPNKLLLPGVCQVNDRVLFFSGLVEKQTWEANESIYWFSLLSKNIGVMKVKFFNAGFTEMKCASMTKKRILILGGFDMDGQYNRTIYRYTMDQEIMRKEEEIDSKYFFCDNNPPIGKYRFAVFFGYPLVFLTRYNTERREYLSIKLEAG